MAKGQPEGQHAHELKSENLAISSIEEKFKEHEPDAIRIFEDFTYPNGDELEWELSRWDGESLLQHFQMSGKPEGDYLEMLCDCYELQPLQVELYYLEMKYAGKL